MQIDEEARQQKMKMKMMVEDEDEDEDDGRVLLGGESTQGLEIPAQN